ncbi:MAG: 16S rRNA (cytosine(1402)-N(4))-methyltransferase RsmH [Phycisphaerales bacterium]
MPAPLHIPVLLHEVLTLLSPQPGQTYVDCTAGLGGHAAAVAARLIPGGTMVLADLDASNLARAADRIRTEHATALTLHTFHGSFAGLPHQLAALNLKANLVLADLGFASNQVDDASRGLSFSRDGPLDMRMNPAATTTAAHLVASLSETELADIIFNFGEERHSRRVAEAIVRARAQSPITTTAHLADIVRSVVRRSPGGGIDPATRTFQALRMAVNDELGNLGALLDAVARPGPWLAPGAVVAIISFHSLEDRPVKQAFTRLVAAGAAEDLTPKPLRAGPSEVASNPRAGSAKLRAVRLVGQSG